MVKATPPKRPSRHGMRAEGMTLVAFPCSRALKNELAALAAKDSRSLAAFLRLKLQETVRRSRAASRGLSQ
jgi:hypothetical protein